MNDLSEREGEVCVIMPPSMHSMGIGLGNYTENGVMQCLLPQMQLQMVIIFLLTQAARFVLKLIGLPPFVSQLLVGILLSPSIIGDGKMRTLLFPNFKEDKSQAMELLDTMELFGYSFFLFLMAVKMDISMLLKVGKKPWGIGILGTIIPMIMAKLALGILKNFFTIPTKEDHKHILTLGILQSVTTFPVVASLLEDLEMLNSELGRLALSSSLVSTTIVVVLAFFASMYEMTQVERLMNLAIFAVFLIVVVFVIRPIMTWIIRRTPEGRPIKDIYLHIILLFVFLSGSVSHLTGQSVLLGTFMLGLAVPDGPPLGSAIVAKLESFFVGIFVPIYVTIAVAKVRIGLLFKDGNAMLLGTIFMTIMFVTKVGVSILPPLYCNIPFNDSLALALILSYRGIVELATYRVAYEVGALSTEQISVAIFTILVLAIMIPISVKQLYNNSRKYAGYERRNILHLKNDADLPILACIHRPENITSTINLLDACFPTKENAMVVHVLHLIQLVGRSAPIFISHQMHTKIVEGQSYSDSIILAFNHFARNNIGAVNVNVYTAISPPKLMFEDICQLALDKSASLIILPFHRKWSNYEGAMEYEDSTVVRALNYNVLQRAPCSVGIYIERGLMKQPNALQSLPNSGTFRVGMFFLGGNDDREGLALAKRMARDTSISLTVVHLSVSDDECRVSWEEIMDSDALEDVKLERLGEHVKYRKELVNDGPHTATLVRQLVNEFNLVIVGMRHGVECVQTTGLSTWTELSELGILGDLLASSDLETKTSVLIVQQQQKQS